jgi:hypothetical protein
MGRYLCGTSDECGVLHVQLLPHLWRRHHLDTQHNDNNTQTESESESHHNAHTEHTHTTRPLFYNTIIHCSTMIHALVGLRVLIINIYTSYIYTFIYISNLPVR